MSFLSDALAAGFTKTQAEFLNERVAQFPHTHEIEEVTGLEEALDLDLEEDEEEEEDE